LSDSAIRYSGRGTRSLPGWPTLGQYCSMKRYGR